MAAPTSSRPLAGQVALVAGGSSRIGRALGLALAHDGADIAFTFRNSAREAAELERDLRASGVRVLALQADLRQSSQVEAVLQQLEAQMGRLDLLVNNLGRYETAVFEALSDDQWEAMVATNLTAPFLLSRAAVPRLRAAGGG
ncbi:MAG: SDR family NAD(P)-dependent oxidoreductase, partial [Terriglobales bacterium]